MNDYSTEKTLKDLKDLIIKIRSEVQQACADYQATDDSDQRTAIEKQLFELLDYVSSLQGLVNKMTNH